MASVDVSEIATLSSNLRAELKEWERDFAAANEGKKAERSDIKKVPEIAAKYKEYSRLKSLEASSKHGKQRQSQDVKPDDRPKKRKHGSPTGPGNDYNTSSPRKTTKGPFTTPSKPRAESSHPSQVDPYDSPSIFRRLFSPSTHQQSSSPLKTAIGPTPQRDGKALGLFDLLSDSGGSTVTPSANRIASIQGAAIQTPSKRRTMDTIPEEEEEEEESPRAERTPASSGKKYMLSTLFATPTTLRFAAMVENENDPEAGAQEKRSDAEANPQETAESDTPSFLRRSNAARYGPTNSSSNAGELSPMPVRKPAQFVGKGLSALVQGLRDMEEEQLQDELDVLYEIEAEQAAASNVEVGDSQIPDNNTGRPFKKKGQKRTTRRVHMKPVVSKSKPEPHLSDPPKGNDSNEKQSDDELAAVPETQRLNSEKNHEEIWADAFDDIDSLHTLSDGDVDSDPEYTEQVKSITRSKSFSEKIKEAIGVSEPQPKDQQKASQPQTKTDENKKPRERKVNPEAHANYRSLKIRNRGTKGRGAGRFRRR
ncbi:hypothetical protein EYZ11_012099 [Aspergillus tanneri]|nr:hypothetical protein EYZ11_012099 [Aspergillus tanneri]